MPRPIRAKSTWRLAAPEEIEVKFLIERRVNGVCRVGQKERIAVRGRTHDRLCADIGGGARPVLADELLAEPLGEPLTHQARYNVGHAGRRIAHYNAHRTRRIALRPRGA